MARWSLRSPLWPELLGGSFLCFSLRGEHESSSMVPGSYFLSCLCASCWNFPGVHYGETNQRSGWSWRRGCRRLVFEGRRHSVWRKTKRLPANASTPLLFVHACGWRHSISRLASLRLACLWGGGPDKRPTLPQDLLLPNIKSRHQLLISSCDLHAIIDQVCRYGVDIPDCGVYELDLFWEGPFSGCPLEQCPRGKLGLASLIQSLRREDQWSWDQGLQKRLVLGPV